MLVAEEILSRRAPMVLQMIRQNWPAHEEPFGWRMLAGRLDCTYEDLCRIKRSARAPSKQVLLAILDVAVQIGVGAEALGILREGSGSEHYSQPASPPGRLSPQAWRQRRARTASRN